MAKVLKINDSDILVGGMGGEIYKVSKNNLSFDPVLGQEVELRGTKDDFAVIPKEIKAETTPVISNVEKNKLEVERVNKEEKSIKLAKIIITIVVILVVGGYTIFSIINESKTDFDVNINNIGTEWQYYYSTNPSLGGENAIIIEGSITAYVDVNYIMIKCEVYSSTGKLLGKPSGGVYIKKGETKNFKIDSFFISTGTPYDVKNIDIVKIN